MTPTTVKTSPRDRLAIALDTPNLDTAVSIAKAVQPTMGVAKVGLELFSAAGREAVQAMQNLGMDVFLDVKLHDIPNTVRGASKVLGSLGVRYLTVHAAGGEAMLAAAVDGLSEGANEAGLPAPMTLAVTVLTSEPSASPELLNERLAAAVAAGCPGVICAAPDLPVIKGAAPQHHRRRPGYPADRHPCPRSRTSRHPRRRHSKRCRHPRDRPSRHRRRRSSRSRRGNRRGSRHKPSEGHRQTVVSAACHHAPLASRNIGPDRRRCPLTTSWGKPLCRVVSTTRHRLHRGPTFGTNLGPDRRVPSGRA